MKREDAEDFTRALGQIVGGSWRLIAHAKKQGVPKALGMSVEHWVERHLGGYVRMSVADRREAVKDLAGGGESTRAIGEVLGVDHVTVLNDLRSGENSPAATISSSENNDLGEAVGENSPLSAVAVLAADDKIRAVVKIAETRRAGEDQRKADLERPVTVVLPEGIIHGDFYELSRGGDEWPDPIAWRRRMALGNTSSSLQA